MSVRSEFPVSVVDISSDSDGSYASVYCTGAYTQRTRGSLRGSGSRAAIVAVRAMRSMSRRDTASCSLPCASKYAMASTAGAMRSSRRYSSRRCAGVSQPLISHGSTVIAPICRSTDSSEPRTALATSRACACWVRPTWASDSR